ncbi:MAG TPA: hypothetical protein VLR94_04360, partial [Acidobacteriota bacterium]|nr:hypothetical protein [Acidobacteriota bacterium]
MGDAASVEQALSALKGEFDQSGPEVAELCHRRLLPLLAERKGALALVLFRFLESEAQRRDDRCELLAGMFHAREPDLRRKTLDLVLKLSAENQLTPDLPLILSIARLAESDGAFRTEQALDGIGALLRTFPPPGIPFPDVDPVAALFLAGSPSILRRLAAHVLDRSQATVS